MMKEGVWLVDVDDVCIPTREKVHKPATGEVKELLSKSLGKKFDEVDFWFERSLRGAYETLGVDINSLWTFTLAWCSAIWGFEVDSYLWHEAMRILMDQYRVNPGQYEETYSSLIRMKSLGGRVIAVSHCEGEQGDREGWGPYKARVTGIKTLFDEMIFLEPLIFKYKDEVAFRWVIEAVGVDPRMCWLVDDNLQAVVAASSLGINAVRLNRGHGNWSVYEGANSQVSEVKTLSEFVDLVRRGGDSNPR